MANLITLTRLVLLFGLVGWMLHAPAPWQWAGPPLLLLIIISDGLDGWIARRRGETSREGGVLDIMADRIVENVMWIVLVFVELAPLWAAVVFVSRGIIVDTIRYSSPATRDSVFGTTRSAWARRIVAGRFMRATYGTAKAVTFAWLLVMYAMRENDLAAWQTWTAALHGTAAVLIWLTVGLCVLRGLPVVIEWLIGRWDVLTGNGRRRTQTADPGEPT